MNVGHTKKIILNYWKYFIWLHSCIQARYSLSQRLPVCRYSLVFSVHWQSHVYLFEQCFILLSNLLLLSDLFAFIRLLWDKSYWNPLKDECFMKKIKRLFDWFINHHEDFLQNFLAMILSWNVPFSFPLNLFFIKTIFHTVLLYFLLCSLSSLIVVNLSLKVMHPELQLPMKGADHRVTKTERRIRLMDACMTHSIQTLHWDLILKSHAHHDKL